MPDPAAAMPPATIGIVTPEGGPRRGGNRVTALRWSLRLRELGHRAWVDVRWRRPCDVLVAVHATKSAAAARAFAGAHPERPLLVLLAGTDVYPAFVPDPATLAALRAATRILALQPLAGEVLPPDLRPRVRVIVQSAAAVAPRPKVADAFQVVVLGHLRPVKNPLLAAAATRRLPATSRVRVVLAGAALDPALGEAAAAETRANPRFRWLGELRHRDALALLAGSHCLLVPSHGEGGANVLSEAIAAGLPVLATDVPGNRGVLGKDHPGLFPVDDEAALAALLARTGEPPFVAALQARTDALQPMVRPAREREDWRRLLQELLP